MTALRSYFWVDSNGRHVCVKYRYSAEFYYEGCLKEIYFALIGVIANQEQSLSNYIYNHMRASHEEEFIFRFRDLSSARIDAEKTGDEVILAGYSGEYYNVYRRIMEVVKKQCYVHGFTLGGHEFVEEAGRYIPIDTSGVTSGVEREYVINYTLTPYA